MPYWGGAKKKEIDLDDLIDKEYPGLNGEIEKLYDEYFLMDDEQVMFQIVKKIDENVRLSKLFPDEELDLKFVKDSGGHNLEIFINNISELGG